MTYINATDLAHAIVLYTVLSTLAMGLICKFYNDGRYRLAFNNFLLCVFFPPASPFYIVIKLIKLRGKRSV